MSALHCSCFPRLMLTASKRRQMALNQMDHLKWRVPLLKDPALLFPPGLLTHLLKKGSKSTIKIHFAAISRLVVLALQCCRKRSVCLFDGHICHDSTTTNHRSSYPRGNYVYSQGFLKKHKTKQNKKNRNKQTNKKKRQKKEQKHFIVLCIYESICLNIEKMYMLTNLWQNILCKTQYLKLQ